MIDDSFSTPGSTGFSLTGGWGPYSTGTLQGSYNGNAGFELAPGGTATRTFTGLDTTTDYDVAATWYAFPSGSAIEVDYTIVGASTVTLIDQFDQRTGPVADYSLEDDNASQTREIAFQTLATITPDANGTITLSMEHTGGFATVDAALVNAVPEPGSLALLGLGGLFAGLRRRRH